MSFVVQSQKQIDPRSQEPPTAARRLIIKTADAELIKIMAILCKTVASTSTLIMYKSTAFQLRTNEELSATRFSALRSFCTGIEATYNLQKHTISTCSSFWAISNYFTQAYRPHVYSHRMSRIPQGDNCHTAVCRIQYYDIPTCVLQ